MAETNVVEKQPVTDEYLKKMDAYWRAANYLGAAQLYLLDIHFYVSRLLWNM